MPQAAFLDAPAVATQATIFIATTSARPIAVDKIPTDVWSMVFVLVVDDWNSKYRDGIPTVPSINDWRKLSTALASLCVVCRKWRHTAVLTSELWTNVYFDSVVPRPLDEEGDWYYGPATCIERSRGRFLTLWFDDPNAYRPLLTYLIDEIRHYRIGRLVLCQFGEHDEYYDEETFLPNSWETTTAMTASVDWSTLAELHLSCCSFYGESNFIGFLRNFTGISKLGVHSLQWRDFEDSDHEPVNPLVFANLRQLYLSNQYLFRIGTDLGFISAPHVEECLFCFDTVHYNGNPHDDSDYESDSDDEEGEGEGEYTRGHPYLTMPEYLTTVRLFTLGLETVHIASIRTILRGVPNVETLEIRSRRRRTYTSVNHILRILHLARGRKYDLVQNLHTLRLDNVRVSCATIVDLLVNREEEGLPVKQVGLAKNYDNIFSELELKKMARKTEVVDWEPMCGLPDCDY